MTAQDLQALLGLGANDFNARGARPSGTPMDLNTLLEMFMRKILEDPAMMERKTVNWDGGSYTGPRDQPGAAQMAMLEKLLTMNSERGTQDVNRESLRETRAQRQAEMDRQAALREDTLAEGRAGREQTGELTREGRRSDRKIQAAELYAKAADAEAQAMMYPDGSAERQLMLDRAEKLNAMAVSLESSSVTKNDVIDDAPVDVPGQPGPSLVEAVPGIAGEEARDRAEADKHGSTLPKPLTPALGQPFVDTNQQSANLFAQETPQDFLKGLYDKAMVGERGMDKAVDWVTGGYLGDAYSGLEERLAGMLRQGQINPGDEGLLQLLMMFMQRANPELLQQPAP